MNKPRNQGIKHGMAIAPFEIVQTVRRRWNNRPRGFRMKQLAREYPDYSMESVRDWAYYRTRVNG